MKNEFVLRSLSGASDSERRLTTLVNEVNEDCLVSRTDTSTVKSISPLPILTRIIEEEKSDSENPKEEAWPRRKETDNPNLKTSVSTLTGGGDVPDLKMATVLPKLNVLRNHLSPRNSLNHVHFPALAESHFHGGMAVVKRKSIAGFTPSELAQLKTKRSFSMIPSSGRRESFDFQKTKIYHPPGPHSTSHLMKEISNHVSVFYCILLIIVSACLWLSSTLTNNMDATVSLWFNCAMLAVSILWLVFALLYLFRQPNACLLAGELKASLGRDPDKQTMRDRFMQNDEDSGSFYLKMGATVFAIGSMIYSCLEMGIFLENTLCFSWVMGLHPCLFIVFVLLQLYFIFKNSQYKITGFRVFSRFGLAHLVATDICVWIRTLLEETIHEITEQKEKLARMHVGSTAGSAEKIQSIVTAKIVQMGSAAAGQAAVQTIIKSGSYKSVCTDGGSNMQQMLEEAAVFLYPCMIEYALITAGIVYIMWQSVGKHPGYSHLRDMEHQTRRRRHPRVFSVDCSHSANGLFAGVLMIVLTIVGLIFYFIYSNDSGEDAELVAVLCADTMSITLNVIGLFAVIYCGWQFFTKLRRIEVHSASKELDQGLLTLTMVGVYAYGVTNIIGHVQGADGYSVLSITSNLMELVQASLQTVFIFDATKRSLVIPSPIRRNSDRRQSDPEKLLRALRFEKPGREMLTLLLAMNFGQWAIDIMCTLRAEADVDPRGYLGSQQWAIVLHMTVPLVIFYRFHSTVCIFDIWKHAYKVRRPSQSQK